MTGILTNVLAVVLGTLFGVFFSKKMSMRVVLEMNKILGVCAIGMGINSILQMENLSAVVFSIILGGFVGLCLRIEERISKIASYLENFIARCLKYSRSVTDTEDETLTLLVTAIVLFSSSATGVYGCLDAGMTGNISILISKSILDFFTAMVFACTLRSKVLLSVIPQFLVYLILFLCAKSIFPLTTPLMIADFKACGGFLLLATGFRVAKIIDVPLADALPALFFVMPASMVWTSYILPYLV